MTDFHMPNSWYDPPDESKCEACKGEGCIHCNEEYAADYRADLQMQATKEGE